MQAALLLAAPIPHPLLPFPASAAVAPPQALLSDWTTPVDQLVVPAEGDRAVERLQWKRALPTSLPMAEINTTSKLAVLAAVAAGNTLRTCNKVNLQRHKRRRLSPADPAGVKPRDADKRLGPRVRLHLEHLRGRAVKPTRASCPVTRSCGQKASRSCWRGRN